jgi:cell division topological specificity factor
VHDRASLSPGLLEALKEDLIQVITKYLEIDEEGLEVNLDKSDDSVALIANIPVKNVKRGTK